MAQSVLVGAFLGSIVLGTTDLQSRLGFFAFNLTYLLTSTTEALPVFLHERRILERETSRGAYRVSSYVTSNAAVFLPFLLAAAVLYAAPVYWLVGLAREPAAFAYCALVVWRVRGPVVNEYSGARGARECLASAGGAGGLCVLDGAGLLRQQGMRERMRWSSLGVMLGFVVGYRVLCFVILSFRCHRTGR
ncbi:ABC transporter G family member 23 [Zea mays]|uniref:ABC transporter G family member 23 n=1 Tax=Zea mays TaxID=4577 RepID=A0A1D6P0U5_MAIZE|nr:ABC transporter G family member 23 [Zea mays]